MIRHPLRCTWFRAVAVVILLLDLCGTPRAQAIQLKDGQVMVGEILEATSEGLSFRRLDTGGVFDLDWSDLSALHAARIKRLQGLVTGDEEEPKVDADVITFRVPAGSSEEVVGIIEKETSSTYTMRRKSGTLEIRRSTITKQRRVQVPASELFSPEDWYQRKLAEIAPGDDADKHIALAEQMRLGRNWEKAEFHLLEAQRLGGGHQASVLPQMIQRVRTLKDAAAERELLGRIRSMRYRGDFTRANALIDEFKQTFPQSKIQSEFDAEVKRVGIARERDLVDRLRQNWDRVVRDVAVDKIAERGLTLAAARTYADEKMADEVYARLAKQLGITPQETKDFWGRRLEFGKITSVLCTYGLGSWLLGADRVAAGTKVEGKANDKGRQAPASDPEAERLIRRMKDAADRMRRAAQSRGANKDEEESDEQWWAAAEHDDKESWLRAYFSEFGGQMELVLAIATPCHNCGGRGTVTSIGTTGNPIQEACSICHRVRFVRSIRAR